MTINRDTRWYLEMFVMDTGRVPAYELEEMACIQCGRGSIQGKLVWRSRIRPDTIIIDVFGKRYQGTDVNYIEESSDA